MKPILLVMLAVTLVATAACTIFRPVTLNPGESEDEVVARLGQPTSRYQDNTDYLLEYAKGPWGQETYMARFDADGKLLSYEQVLTVQKFGTIQIGKSTKADVLRIIGAPGETSYLPLRDFEVWSYAYKENDIWNSMMHVHFDKAGVVQQMLNGPDPRFDPSERFPLRHGRR